jgi:hypothetical protein
MTKDWKALVIDGIAKGVTKSTVVPFSNLGILDAAVDVVKETFGADTPMYVDGKFSHTLQQTHLRLVLPNATRVIESHRHNGEKPDEWSIGINIGNSLIGATGTCIEGFLFAWTCANGAIDVKVGTAGSWSRRSGGQDEEVVVQWVHNTVEEVLKGLEGSLDKVAALTVHTFDGGADEVSEALRDVFNTYRVPTAQRTDIITAMVNTDDLSMYGIMQAITSVANQPGLDPSRVDALMRIGGELPHTAMERCDNCRRLLPH